MRGGGNATAGLCAGAQLPNEHRVDVVQVLQLFACSLPPNNLRFFQELHNLRRRFALYSVHNGRRLPPPGCT